MGVYNIEEKYQSVVGVENTEGHGGQKVALKIYLYVFIIGIRYSVLFIYLWLLCA